MIGARMIRRCGIYIGGNKIQEIDADFIMAKAMADYDRTSFLKWENLVGNIPDLTDPANGSTPGGGVPGTYPLVVNDAAQPGPQTNAPSIPGRTIRVPVPFWFTQGFSQSLPLIGLQYHDVEFRITLAPIRDLYTILDENGYRVRPGFQTVPNLLDISGQTPQYITISDPSGSINNFLVDFGNSTPVRQGWPLNPNIELTYIYVTKEEGRVFATQPLSYLIYQPFSVLFENISNQQLLEIEIHNPITRMIFLPRRSDSDEYRNDWTNITNWWQYPQAPWISGSNPLAAQSSGKLISGGQQQIIRNLRVLGNGNELQQQKPNDYFTGITPWRYLNGNPKNLPIYSFQIHPQSIQPSGSVNSSRIRLLQVEIDVFPLPVNTTYVYDINLYMETINWFIVEGGYGGIKYNI